MTSTSKYMRIAVVALMGVALAGCDNMNDTQQRTLSGAGIGAGVGTVGTVMTGGCVTCGAAIGAAVGAGGGYIYDHDTPEGFSGQEYFPETLGRQNFYRPVERGFEREIIKRLDYWTKLRAKKAEEE